MNKSGEEGGQPATQVVEPRSEISHLSEKVRKKVVKDRYVQQVLKKINK